MAILLLGLLGLYIGRVLMVTIKALKELNDN